MVSKVESEKYNRRAIYYLAYRRLGKRAIDAHNEAKKLFNNVERLTTDGISGGLIREALPCALAIWMAVQDMAVLRGLSKV